MPKCLYAQHEQQLSKPEEGFLMTLHTHPFRGCPGCLEPPTRAGRERQPRPEALAHLLQGCSHHELLFTSLHRKAQPVPAPSRGALLCPGSDVPTLHPPGHWHSHRLSLHCSTVKMMLLERSVWGRRWLGSVWDSEHDADGNVRCRCWLVHGSAGWQRQLPQAHSPGQAELASPELGWHLRVCRRLFPLGKAVCVFAVIRLQRNAKGAREMKHILSQVNGQINTGKKAKVSDQTNSDQSSGFKMKIRRVLKSWVASWHVGRAADPQLQAFPCRHSTSTDVQQLQGSMAAHPTPPRGERLWRHWAISSDSLSRI